MSVISVFFNRQDRAMKTRVPRHGTRKDTTRVRSRNDPVTQRRTLSMPHKGIGLTDAATPRQPSLWLYTVAPCARALPDPIRDSSGTRKPTLHPAYAGYGTLTSRRVEPPIHHAARSRAPQAPRAAACSGRSPRCRSPCTGGAGRLARGWPACPPRRSPPWPGS